MAINNLFFTLTPEKFAKAIAENLPEILTPAQRLQAEVILVTASSKALVIAEEKMRLQGSLPARGLDSPLSSVTRTAMTEKYLYDYVFAADEAAVAYIAQPQTFTSTAHPSFARTRNLKIAGNPLVTKLASFTLDDLEKIAKTGKLSNENRQDVNPILSDISNNLKVRENKRTRQDELQETALDPIPEIIAADREQLKIIKQRSGEKFSNTAQLRAVSAMLPEFNNWFLDGDGKRTVHVFDAEYAIPAVKAETLEAYRSTLSEVEKRTNNTELSRVLGQIYGKIDLYEEVSELASNRMNALNELHAAKNFDPYNIEAVDRYNNALAEAEAESLKYKNKLSAKIAGSMVRNILTSDDTAELKDTLERVLTAHYEGEKKLPDDLVEVAESIYISMHHRGNYASKLQRRENARQYQEVLEYLVGNNREFEKALCEKLGVEQKNIHRTLKNPDRYLEAVNLVAESALSPEDSMNIRGAFFESYKQVAGKLAGFDEDEKYIVIPLEDRELLTLDALGHFRMANLYPEAFKAGFITAEYAQPDITILRTGDQNQIKEEVVRLAEADSLLQIAFAYAMGAEKTKIIPLHEDPATMRYASDAKSNLLKNKVYQEYLQQFMGVQTIADAEQKCSRKLDSEGKIAAMMAYEVLAQEGISEKEMQERGLDIKMLKRTRVLIGPDDMQACSDNTKRAGAIGLELADLSVRETKLAFCANPLQIEGEAFVVISPKYYGQGGSMMRATGVPMDVTQATWQGEHLMWLTALAIAFENSNRMFSRLAMRHGVETDERILENAANTVSANISNTLGVPGHLPKTNERELLFGAMQEYIGDTRDNSRCDAYLKKYGISVPNWSARPDNKTESTSIFNPGRAIGVAGQMMRLMNNIISTEKIFDVGSKGAGKGEITEASAKEIREWLSKDGTLQQIMASGAFMANIVDPAKVWSSHGMALTKNEQGAATITDKNGNRVALEKLVEAFDKGVNSYKDPNGATFDAADLYLADLTCQHITLEKGLLAVYKKPSLIDLFEPEHQGTVAYYKELHERMIDLIDQYKGKKGPDADFAKGIYYILFESGPQIYPQPGVLQARRCGYEREVTTSAQAVDGLQSGSRISSVPVELL